MAEATQGDVAGTCESGRSFHTADVRSMASCLFGQGILGTGLEGCAGGVTLSQGVAGSWGPETGRPPYVTKTPPVDPASVFRFGASLYYGNDEVSFPYYDEPSCLTPPAF